MDSIHHQHSKEIYSGEYEILEVSDPPSSKSNTHTFHRSIRLTYWRSASRIKRNRRSAFHETGSAKPSALLILHLGRSNR